jgi:hypothetical protein
MRGCCTAPQVDFGQFHGRIGSRLMQINKSPGSKALNTRQDRLIGTGQ